MRFVMWEKTVLVVIRTHGAETYFAIASPRRGWNYDALVDTTQTVVELHSVLSTVRAVLRAISSHYRKFRIVFNACPSVAPNKFTPTPHKLLSVFQFEITGLTEDFLRTFMSELFLLISAIKKIVSQAFCFGINLSPSKFLRIKL